VLYRLSDTVKEINPSTAAETTRTLSGAQAGQYSRYVYAVYVEALDRILLIRENNAQTIYQINPATWEMTTYSVAGTPPTAAYTAPPAEMTQTGLNRLYGRFFHAPELRLVGIVRSTSDNVHVFKY
jgi:hypothetical protein